MAWPETVRKEDLRLDYYRGSGKGGQNRNKRDTACRITHLPTGIAASAEDQRTQELNRRSAFRRLAAKLEPLMRQAAQHKEAVVVTERIRTYHEPRGEVKDHRTGFTYGYRDVLDGPGLEKIWDDLRTATERRGQTQHTEDSR